MQTLIKKSTGNWVEIIDGSLIETDTPTLFTDKATVDSIHDATEFVNKATFVKDDYELWYCALELKYLNKNT